MVWGCVWEVVVWVVWEVLLGVVLVLVGVVDERT